MWKPMHPLCILHWNTQLIISLLGMNNFPQIILVSEIVVTYTLSLISVVHGNCSVYDDYSLLREVRTFQFFKNVSRLFLYFSFPAFASCISTRPGFWFTFFSRAAALQAVFHVHSTCMCFGPCILTVSFFSLSVWNGYFERVMILRRYRAPRSHLTVELVLHCDL